ncbi:MAG TPA: SSI family serine proteinase inhibitor [Streptomyces sp.]|nr:SSI family serine proteinase inhibitor [Streptomyces sp.]
MIPRPRATAAAAVAALLTLVPAATAHAQAPGPAQAHGEIFLTVSDSARTWSRGVLLICPDRSGHHPRAAEACADLDRAGGELRQLSGRERMCTMEYAPVIATASGLWQGRQVTWRGTFSNTCALTRNTGAVFDF